MFLAFASSAWLLPQQSNSSPVLGSLNFGLVHSGMMHMDSSLVTDWSLAAIIILIVNCENRHFKKFSVKIIAIIKIPMCTTEAVS